jgi:tRNA dimethylallyltransferase
MSFQTSSQPADLHAFPARPLFLAGPTAVGKSEIALLLAEMLGGEIISVDSMQVYRGMDIGTDKPSLADRARVVHHLIDVVEVTEEFNAARFVTLARHHAAEILSRGRVPIFCGGTGLYFRAFLQGLGETPPPDPSKRAELETTPLPILLQELAQSDPQMFERIDRQNARRVIRAVEVIRLTGKPFSKLRADWLASSPAFRPRPALFGVTRHREDLHKRIESRVDEMFHRGLVAETRALVEKGLAENRTASQALGYRQVVEHLQGSFSLPETVARVKVLTRQFAKRQMTWFRRQLTMDWTQLASNEPSAHVAQELAIKFNSQK